MTTETGKLQEFDSIREKEPHEQRNDASTAKNKEPSCDSHVTGRRGRILLSVWRFKLCNLSFDNIFSPILASFELLQAVSQVFDETMNLDTTPHRIQDPAKHDQPSKSFPRSSLIIVVVTLLLAAVVACDLAMEVNILSSRFEFTLASTNTSISNNTIPISTNGSSEELTCTPNMVNLSEIKYHSDHRYYTILKETNLQPPIFRENHAALCNNTGEKELGYEYCLPISGRKDSPFCTGADRMDLLTHHSNQIRCYASVLHMLLVEVYEELYARGKTPIVVFGSLLGAVRNGSMIPFTEDTDIAYTGQLSSDDDLGRALVAKGYHFFFLKIWRVCVAPTHPLAARLYNPRLPVARNYLVPYLDLYAMEKLNETHWSMEGYHDDTLPADKVEPFSQVTINGLSFNTVQDPNYFLVEMYGDDYLIPKPRN